MACTLCVWICEECPECSECFCSCRCDQVYYCNSCGQPNCPGYCDDFVTYNLRPAETGGTQVDITVTLPPLAEGRLPAPELGEKWRNRQQPGGE
jgi:hypothetical protein